MFEGKGMEEGEGAKNTVFTHEHLHPAPLMAARDTQDLIRGMENILIHVSWR